MFFAETLGPALTRRASAALFEHVQVKLRGQTSASSETLRTIVSEFITVHGLMLNPDALIQYLTIHGRITQQDAATFRLAA